MAIYLLLSKIQVHNANAMSSPYTVGFPSMTAWLGAVHALERQVNVEGFPNARFTGVAVASHSCNVQRYKDIKTSVYHLCATRNPLTKDGKPPSFIPEARCHLCVSILLRTQGIDAGNSKQLEETIAFLLERMKLAGGDVESISKIEVTTVSDESDEDERRLLRRLMPSYVLIERRDLMMAEAEGGKDTLDMLLDMLAVEYESQAGGNRLKGQGKRRAEGWLVPIAVGFKAISDKVAAGHQRALEYEHFFAEPIVTLGEFRMPYHFQRIDEILWDYHTDLTQGLYLCRNLKH